MSRDNIYRGYRNFSVFLLFLIEISKISLRNFDETQSEFSSRSIDSITKLIVFNFSNVINSLLQNLVQRRQLQLKFPLYFLNKSSKSSGKYFLQVHVKKIVPSVIESNISSRLSLSHLRPLSVPTASRAAWTALSRNNQLGTHRIERLGDSFGRARSIETPDGPCRWPVGGEKTRTVIPREEGSLLSVAQHAFGPRIEVTKRAMRSLASSTTPSFSPVSQQRRRTSGDRQREREEEETVSPGSQVSWICIHGCSTCETSVWKAGKTTAFLLGLNDRDDDD